MLDPDLFKGKGIKKILKLLLMLMLFGMFDLGGSGEEGGWDPNDAGSGSPDPPTGPGTAGTPGGARSDLPPFGEPELPRQLDPKKCLPLNPSNATDFTDPKKIPFLAIAHPEYKGHMKYFLKVVKDYFTLDDVFHPLSKKYFTAWVSTEPYTITCPIDPKARTVIVEFVGAIRNDGWQNFCEIEDRPDGGSTHGGSGGSNNEYQRETYKEFGRIGICEVNFANGRLNPKNKDVIVTHEAGHVFDLREFSGGAMSHSKSPFTDWQIQHMLTQINPMVAFHLWPKPAFAQNTSAQ